MQQENSLSLFHFPETLDQVYGQKEIVSFLKAVLKSPDFSPHYFGLFGPLGCGKTSIVKAFANDLHADFYELDSTDKKILEDFQNLKSVLFVPTSTYRVVLFDECHVLGDHQDDLLKILETTYTNLFIFFCTTEPESMKPTLVSRIFDFKVQSFSRSEITSYIKALLTKEGKVLSDPTISIISMLSQGSIRNAKKYTNMALLEGEAFLQRTSEPYDAVSAYFCDPAIKTTDLSERLKRIPVPQLKELIRDTFVLYLEKEPHSKNDIHFVLSKYFQMSSFVREPGDFYLFLDAFRRSVLFPTFFKKQMGSEE